MVETATATALGQASGSATRAMSQNVRYKMTFNASTGQWVQEQIMTPLVKPIYPGIRTKEGKTKDVATGAIVAPPGQITTTTPVLEPEVSTPLPTMTDGTTTGLGGYQQVQQQYQQPTPSTTGGVRYEPEQLSRISEPHKDRIKYAVMPGGLNLRSSSQNFSLSQSHGLIDDLVNPKTQEQTETKESKFKLPGMLGTAVKIAGTMIQPRSERLQITKMIESGAIRVRDESTGRVFSNDEAIKALTQDENGRIKILKGQDLINSGYKVDQIKHLSEDYANSPAFMNFKEDTMNNFSAPNGNKLITLNPVMGNTGTTLFGIFKDAVGASGTTGEQVLVVGESGGGGYTSNGKFVGMNGRVYGFGTAAQASASASAGHIPTDVLTRMTNEDGTLKDLYLSGDFAINPNMIVNNRYIGNVVNSETKDIISNGGDGDVVGNTQKDDTARIETREQELKDAEDARQAREKLKELAKKGEPKKDVWQPRDAGPPEKEQKSPSRFAGASIGKESAQARRGV